MITIKSDTEIKKCLDELTYKFIVEQMQKDCPIFSQSIDSKEYEWIGRVILMSGSDHIGSNIPFGYLLKYQFRKVSVGYDMGIKEIKIPESSDEFLDLMNDIKRNPEMFNLKYSGK